jgi:DNA mismatch repair ATPase MutS
MGARLLRDVLLHPTQNSDIIKTRQLLIGEYMKNVSIAKRVQEILHLMVDMPKIVSTLLYKKTAPTVF